MKHTFRLLLLGVFLPLALCAKDITDHYNFTYYQIKNGLCDEYVLSSYKDSKGYMWFCTSNGLDRFDGNIFVHYNTHNSDPATRLNSNFVYRVTEDRHGRIWGVSNQGLFRINPGENSISFFKELPGPDGKFLAKPMISMDKDKDGNLWMCTRAELIYVKLTDSGEVGTVHSISMPSGSYIRYMYLQGDRVWLGSGEGILCFNRLDDTKIIPVDLSDYPGLEKISSVSTIYVNGNYLWVGTEKGLYRYNLMNKTLESFLHDKNDPYSLADDHVTCLGMNRTGNMLIGTTRGVDVLTRDNRFEHIGQNTPQYSLNTTYVNHLLVDEQNYLWVSTLVGGVNLLTPKRVSYEVELNVIEGITNIVSCVYQDDEDNLLVGVLGKGLAIKDRGSDHYRFFSLKELGGLTQDDIFNICQDYNRDYWISTRNDGLVLLRKQDLHAPTFTVYSTANSSLDSNLIVDMVPDYRRRGLWICTNKAILFFDVERKDFQPIRMSEGGESTAYHALMLDSKERLWVGGYGLHIVYLKERDLETGIYPTEFYQYKLDHPGSGLDERVSSIVETNNGQIFIGSQNNGIYTIRERTANGFVFETIPINYRNFSNRVSKLLKDNAGNLWIGSVEGFYHYDTSRLLLTSFDTTDGLPSCQCYINSGGQFNDGSVCFGTTNGLVVFNSPFNMEPGRERTVTIAGVMNENRFIEMGDGMIDIYPQSPSFDIYFSALDYYNSEDVVYSYKLEKLDKEWNIESGISHIRYNNLQPGRYTFRIRCTNTDSSWSSQDAVLQIHVHPRFYQTGWFIALVVFTVAFICLLAVLQYMRHQRLIRERLKQKVEEKTKSLTETLENLTLSKNAIDEQNILLQEQNKEIRKQKTQIEEYSLKMDRINQERLMLFTNLTHEFKTPLTLILGPVNDLIAKDKEKKLQPSIRIVDRNARILLSLVNQIMDLRKVDTGQIKFTPEDIDILELLNVYAMDYQSVFNERYIHYETQSRLLHRCIRADKDAVYKILSNLVSNAIKYTPNEGSIVVKLAQWKSADSRIAQYISVHNTGSYIEPSELEKIFQCFYKLKNQESYSFYGQSSSGVGLYMVRQLVEALGGKIMVKSSPAKGTVFRLYFNVDFADEEVELRKHTSGGFAGKSATEADNLSIQLPTEENGKPVLLLAEDNEDMRSYIKNLLSDRYFVAEAANGQKGYELARQIVPDFIISDLMMPLCDGIAFCKLIRQDEALSHIPFLMLTALSNDNARLSSYKQGVDAFLTKPFDSQMLLARIENILSNRKQQQTELTVDLSHAYAKVEIEKSDKVFMKRLLEILEENYTNSEFSITDLKEKVGMSSTSFYKKITALTGLTPSHFIRLYRLQTARKLLETHVGKNDISVSELAYMVGFNDPKYFSKCFVKQYGVLPSSVLQGTEVLKQKEMPDNG